MAAAPGVADADPNLVLPVPDTSPELARVIFYLFPGQPTEPVVARVHRFGEVLGAGRTEHIGMVRARLPLARVPDVAQMPEVREVIPDAKPAVRNDAAVKVLTRNPPAFDPPVHGEGQVIGHADTGLDIGVNDASLHAAFRGRVKRAFALGRAGAGDWSDYDGHGTHTAGSIFGAGEFAGSAPKAELVHQSVGDAEGGLGGIPDPLGTLFEQAYAEGARIHSNSWGVPIRKVPSLAGQYLRGLEVDTWTWNGGQPRDMLIVIAAGNDGSVGVGSVGSPATAKNCLAVGACENLRPAARPAGRRPVPARPVQLARAYQERPHAARRGGPGHLDCLG